MGKREEWRKNILDDLGGEGVDPDLTDNQLDSCINRALALWNKHRPFVMWLPFEVPAGETLVITFFAETAQNDPQGNPTGYVEKVLDVQMSDMNRRILGPRAGFLEGYYLRWGYMGPRLFFQLHVAERAYERMTGSRPDWRWEPTTRNLYITSPGRDTRAMVLCSRAKRIEEVSFDNESDFRQLAVAAAKSVLAQQLKRRGNMPGPAGEIKTDADELRKEGKEEWEAIRSRLESSLMSVPPVEYIG